MAEEMVKKLRNVAVIAHVDHGKTTLVDAMLKQTHTFRDNQAEMNQERILDSNDLEREKGITILAKNASVEYQGYKINIIDTPGHADFSGEVERTLGMADGALLIVDAQEGPMPQTRFVLKKAFELGLKVIVVVNKIDKPFARTKETISRVQNLVLDLATTDEQLDFPILFAIGRDGRVFANEPENLETPGDVTPLLSSIIEYIPAPKNKEEGDFVMLISSLDYDTYRGRVVIGRIEQGKIKPGDRVYFAGQNSGSMTIESVLVNQGLGRVPVEEAVAGDIVALLGIGKGLIGMTLAAKQAQEALPAAELAEPTLHMTLGPNTSPLNGQEGEFTTSRQLEERLMRELEKNLSLRVEKLDSGKFKLSGRGELHLAVLLETMRREGYEMEVGKPEAIVKVVDGVKMEPVEEVNVIVPQENLGTVTQEMGKRLGQMLKMEPISEAEVEFVYKMPTRSLIGLRSLLLTATRGTVLFSSQFDGFQPVGQTLPKLRRGVLIASESGDALAYGLQSAQSRGVTFVNPGTKVYEGMIVGENAKDEDIEINVTKGKKLTNMRAASGDAIIQLAPAVQMSLEQSIDFLEPDELLEITPKSLRLRKRFLTDIERRRQRRA